MLAACKLPAHSIQPAERCWQHCSPHGGTKGRVGVWGCVVLHTAIPALRVLTPPAPTRGRCVSGRFS